jgi:hypothetical protein
MIRICVSNQSVPACGEESAHKKTHKSEDAGLKDTCVFHIQAANLSFQNPHSAASMRICARLITAGVVFLGLRQGRTKYLARSGIAKDGGKFPLILICLEPPWQHTARATILLGQNLI